MANNNIIIDASFEQIRVAIVENNELVEFYVEDDKYISEAGSIYKGIVNRVLPGMEAAFVDIGAEKNAFLYVGDAVNKKSDHEITEKVNISDIIQIGQEIFVQIKKEQRGDKGPKVTTNISLPGRFLILMPNTNYIAISRRIEDEDEREKLKKIIEKIKPNGFGVIVRTMAQGLSEDDFKQDIDALVNLWDTITQKAEKYGTPCLIHSDLNLIERTVRDIFTYDTNKLVINNKEYYNDIIEFVMKNSPGLTDRIEYYNKDYDIFQFYGIESNISRLLSRKVWLKSGGYIVIDKTEALTVIDVNSGKYVGSQNLAQTILRTNIEAAREITKQLRLRDIGGIIIIDFIDMLDQDSKEKLLKLLEECLKLDRTKTVLVGITELGLVEITRKKIRQNLSSKLQVDCSCCSGTGRIVQTEMIIKDIYRKIKKITENQIVNAIVVEAHPVIIKILEERKGYIDQIKNQHKKSVILKSNNSKNIELFEVKSIDNIKYLC